MRHPISPPVIQQVLDDGSVKYLQARGIKVLLSITNGHQPVGWSQFTSGRQALDFARYLKESVVARYGRHVEGTHAR
jgi:hypothetical protein